MARWPRAWQQFLHHDPERRHDAGTVDVSTTSGSTTLVYEVDRSNGVVSISPIDVTTTSGLNTLTSALVAGSQVKVYGTPQTDGTYRAYVLMYFTATDPAD